MQSPADLPLRDIHPATAAPWWPLAPGWWLVIAASAICAAAVAFLIWRRRRRRRAIARLFDDSVSRATTPASQVATISELLRRASRRRDPLADRLQGEAWLRFLDEEGSRASFQGAPGDLLLDGAFRGDVEAAEVEALRGAARARFLEWMGAK